MVDKYFGHANLELVMGKNSDVRVLYIEDEPLRCDLFKTAIEAHGYAVDLACNRKEALSLCATTAYDLVAIDCQLPDLTGTEIARSLLAGNPGLPLLMVTERGREQIAIEALTLGIASYVVKDEEHAYLELIPGLIEGLLERAEQSRKQREAERALERSEQRYRDLISASPVCIHEIDLDGKLISMNPAGLKIMGVDTVDKVCGVNYLDVPVPGDRERIAGLLERAKQGKGSQFEFSSAGKSGLLQFSSSFEPIVDDDGNVVRLMGVTQEITDRKLAEEAIRASEEHFRMYFELGLVGMSTNSLEKGWIHVNDRLCEIFGYSREELKKLTWADISHPDDLASDTANFERMLAGEIDGYSLDKRFIHKSGRIIHARISVKSARRAGGQADQILAIVSDITERKQAEEALRESEAHFRSLVEAMPQKLYRLDMEGCFDFANEAYLKLLGTTLENLVGKPATDFYPSGLAEKHRADDDRVLRTGETFTCVERQVLPGTAEEVYMEFVKTPIRDSNGEIIGLQGIFWDVTERENLEALLRRSQKMEAVGQLTGGIAHDFNNLLGIMLGNVELLQRRIHDDKEAQGELQRIERAVDRAVSLTSRLLAFSRQQALSPVAADIFGLIGGLEDMLRRTLGATIDLRVEPNPELWPATIDPHQFEDVLVNLSINARDAMPDGGTLVVEASNITLDETFTERQGELEPGDYVMVAVSDTGTGMPPEILEKVFEPFFTTKDVGKGSGLGLSMVYGFAKQSNGHVTIYSEVGHGTTVKLYMPRSEKDAVEEDIEGGGRVFATGSERMLVVEDDEDLRRFPVTILRGQGYEVVEAKNSQEALDHLNKGPAFDLLFTDVILPGGMNGVEIAKQAKQLQPSIRVLYTTGYTENAVLHQGQLNPGVTLLNKPYRRDELLEKVREMLKSQSVLLIDDDKNFRATLMIGLERSGYKVTPASGGIEGLKFINSNRYDAVITDIFMEKGEGVETLGWIEKAAPGVPVIGISGDSRYLGNFKRLGAAATLRKPFKIEELVGILRDVIPPGDAE